MKIAELRNHPFLLLVLKDGESEGYFDPEFLRKTRQQLIDMSLRITSDNLSIIYADQIKKGCEIVLGMSNLGLLELCKNDTNKAKTIIKAQGVVYCFRAGWAKYAELKKISPAYFEEISITRYALGINDISDIKVMHQSLVKEGQQSARLLNIYKSMAATYGSNALLIDNDEDMLAFELQRFLNSAITLLLMDSDKKLFTSSVYQQLIVYLTQTEKADVLMKLQACIDKFSQQLAVSTKDYLQEMGLLEFSELKGIIEQQNDISMYIQEILELPLTLINELNNDFEGGYDFHGDDENELAYLRPEE